MSDHTKKPWQVVAFGEGKECDNWSVDNDSAATYEFSAIMAGEKTVALVVSTDFRLDTTSEISSRIVACVNACAEIPTEDLEESSMTILQYMEDQYAEKLELAKQQRDELLAALEQIANESVRNLGSARIVARDAIAKAEAQS